MHCNLVVRLERGHGEGDHIPLLVQRTEVSVDPDVAAVLGHVSSVVLEEVGLKEELLWDFNSNMTRGNISKSYIFIHKQ